jgi:hypothetical protein
MQPAYPQPQPGAVVSHLCPFCNARVEPREAAQTCSACGKKFLMRFGAALDPRVVPPPVDPALPTIQVKWATAVTYEIAKLYPYGVSTGMADPIAGMVALNESGVNFTDIGTLTFYRKPEIARAVVIGGVNLAIVVVLAMAEYYLAALVFAVPLVFFGYFWLVVRSHFARVVGRYHTMVIRFDEPMWTRARFYSELQRRAGLAPMPMP